MRILQKSQIYEKEGNCVMRLQRAYARCLEWDMYTLVAQFAKRPCLGWLGLAEWHTPKTGITPKETT